VVCYNFLGVRQCNLLKWNLFLGDGIVRIVLLRSFYNPIITLLVFSQSHLPKMIFHFQSSYCRTCINKINIVITLLNIPKILFKQKFYWTKELGVEINKKIILSTVFKVTGNNKKLFTKLEPNHIYETRFK
jgi:hypothetical protein